MTEVQGQKILIVDDEPQMLELLRAYLEKEEFLVDEATNGKEAMEKISNDLYNCVILDVMMPEKDGLSTCLEIRESSAVPIIMLTARGDELDRIHGLELGADDYIVKPFSPRELVARVKALLRRVNISFNVEQASIIKNYGNILLDEKAKKVTIDGELLELHLKNMIY